LAVVQQASTPFAVTKGFVSVRFTKVQCLDFGLNVRKLGRLKVVQLKVGKAPQRQFQCMVAS
jgi:hypothetical protein